MKNRDCASALLQKVTSLRISILAVFNEVILSDSKIKRLSLEKDRR